MFFLHIVLTPCFYVIPRYGGIVFLYREKDYWETTVNGLGKISVRSVLFTRFPRPDDVRRTKEYFVSGVRVDGRINSS